MSVWEVEMADSERRYIWLSTITTGVVVALASAIVLIANNYGFSEQYEPIWNFCREANYPLGVVAAVGVSYRLTLMILDRRRWYSARGVHLMLWFAYIAASLMVTAVSSAHYAHAEVPGTWTSGVRTLLMIGAVVLTAWWPHPHPYEELHEDGRQ